MSGVRVRVSGRIRASGHELSDLVRVRVRVRIRVGVKG